MKISRQMKQTTGADQILRKVYFEELKVVLKIFKNFKWF